MSGHILKEGRHFRCTDCGRMIKAATLEDAAELCGIGKICNSREGF